MFILDVFKFCESYERFNRQHLARFIYQHRECERLAKLAGVTTRYFASSSSKEFLARCMTSGYIDGVNNWYWAISKSRRPFGFEFRSFRGNGEDYIKEIMSINEMSDDELFK